MLRRLEQDAARPDILRAGTEENQQTKRLTSIWTANCSAFKGPAKRASGTSLRLLEAVLVSRLHCQLQSSKSVRRHRINSMVSTLTKHMNICFTHRSVRRRILVPQRGVTQPHPLSGQASLTEPRNRRGPPSRKTPRTLFACASQHI